MYLTSPNGRDADRPRARPPVAAGIVVVPVLRAGLGMLDAVLELVPRRGSATSGCSATR